MMLVTCKLSHTTDRNTHHGHYVSLQCVQKHGPWFWIDSDIQRKSTSMNHLYTSYCLLHPPCLKWKFIAELYVKVSTEKKLSLTIFMVPLKVSFGFKHLLAMTAQITIMNLMFPLNMLKYMSLHSRLIMTVATSPHHVIIFIHHIVHGLLHF